MKDNKKQFYTTPRHNGKSRISLKNHLKSWDIDIEELLYLFEDEDEENQE